MKNFFIGHLQTKKETKKKVSYRQRTDFAQWLNIKQDYVSGKEHSTENMSFCPYFTHEELQDTKILVLFL